MILNISVPSVGLALYHGLHHLRRAHIIQESRNGPVLVFRHPVMTTYTQPSNRVLFSPLRDANPFFHVMEALWMFAGRNDIAWPKYFNSRFNAYSDDGIIQSGAYGFRWREHFGWDQLADIAKELRANPQTRRAVLSMWDGHSDFNVALAGGVDVPCNTHAYFDTIDGKLNMTVCCRSNDILWGAYGANAVHMSMLLEYMAAATGLPMGVYRQFSNNFHLYTDILAVENMMALANDAKDKDIYTKMPWATGGASVPLVSNSDVFIAECEMFIDDPNNDTLTEPFITGVAQPMYTAFCFWKEKKYDKADLYARHIVAHDWRTACTEWLDRRTLKRSANNAG